MCLCVRRISIFYIHIYTIYDRFAYRVSGRFSHERCGELLLRRLQSSRQALSRCCLTNFAINFFSSARFTIVTIGNAVSRDDCAKAANLILMDLHRGEHISIAYSIRLRVYFCGFVKGPLFVRWDIYLYINEVWIGRKSLIQCWLWVFDCPWHKSLPSRVHSTLWIYFFLVNEVFACRLLFSRVQTISRV